jgi:subtilisin-like proprotein convertase family protein
MKHILLTALVLLFGVTGFSQESNYWSSVERGSVDFEGDFPLKEYEIFKLNVDKFEEAIENGELIQLPVGKNNFEAFNFTEAINMAPELKKKFPSIKTYKGKSNDGSQVRFDYSNAGLKVILRQHGKTIKLIEPVGNNNYVVFEETNIQLPASLPHFECLTKSIEDENALNTNSRNAPSGELKKYRLAVSTTYEFSLRSGGTKESVLTEVNSIINRVNFVFNEVGVVMELVPNADDLFFLDVNDPFTNGSPGALLSENPGAINAIIPQTNYDIGHVFGTGAGGVAALSSVCGGRKANASSSTFGAYSGFYFFHIVTHEMGHQFSSNHTFNFCEEGTDSNANPGTAYEPGAGSTVMSYSGASSCSVRWIQNRSDSYFHTYSVQSIFQFTRSGNGSTCGISVPTENETPNIDLSYENGFYIPKLTPFKLEGKANDGNQDSLTFCWEQYNRGQMSPLGSPIGDAPAFRSITPTADDFRYFPSLNNVVANRFDRTEVLQDTSRDYTFRLTVRDNNEDGGAFDIRSLSFKSTSSAGPFRVLNFNAADTVNFGDFADIEWDVAGTDESLVNCQEVNIFMSIDGGATFPITLETNTNNDGFASVLIPDFNETQIDCRFMVAAADNIFFNVNSSDFVSIESEEARFGLGFEAENSTICFPESSSIQFEIRSAPIQGFTEEINLNIEGLPTGAVSTFSKNPVQPGETSIVTVDLNGISDLGIFNVKVVGNSNSIQNFERSTEIKILSTDFSTLNLNDPPNGASGISFGPRLEWVDVPDALLYDVEISDDPTFQSNVQTRSNTTVNFYNPLQSLSPNTTYYWRVKPKNDCTDGQFTAPNAFRTGTFACTEYEAQDVPIFISGSGTPTRTSTISIGESGSIEDVNLKNIKGDHEIFSDLEFSLSSPAGTEVLLFKNKCGNVGATFDFNLDDEASIAFNCSALGLGWDHRPDSSLAKFIGEDTQGDWVLTMKDNRATASGGVDSWTVEFCAPLSTEKPNLATNLIFPVQKNGTRRISNEFLNITDNNFAASELEYTLVVNTQEGSLFLNNNPINVGQTFTQSDIDNGNLKYGHNGGDIDNDYFTFVVVNPDGGFFGTPNFEISIAEDVSTSTEEIASSDLIILYPNPARDLINLRFEEVKQEDIEVSIYNIQGKTLFQSMLPANREIQIPTIGFASGIYIAKVRRGDEIIVKRFEVIN